MQKNNYAAWALYALVYLVLFGTWAALVWTEHADAAGLGKYIETTLVALTAHVFTLINSAPSAGGKQP